MSTGSKRGSKRERKGSKSSKGSRGSNRSRGSGRGNKQSGAHWTTDPLFDKPISLTKEGVGSSPPTTVMEVFKQTVSKFGDQPALNFEKDDAWTSLSWKQYYDGCIDFAKALLALKLKPATAVSILGFNSPEWFMADVGAIAAGCIAAGIYTTNGPEACQYVIEHSSSAVVVVENDLQLQKILSVRKQLKKVKAIVQWDGEPSSDAKDVYSWKAFLALGAKITDADIEKRMSQSAPGQCCTLIYTSGTTSAPKAVMISHDNLTWTVSSVVRHCLNINEKDRLVSYLPLSHVAAQMIDIHNPLATGAQVFFARPTALKGTLKITLAHVRPTVFLGVPRVWEKIQETMLSLGASNPAPVRAIGAWAKKVGLKNSRRVDAGKKGKPAFFGLANKLVFSKVAGRLGLDQCRYAATAAAPIAKETLDYFNSLNIRIYEIYGMSESTGPQTVNRPDKFKAGTAGPVFPGAEIKIDKPDANSEGEICFRGRHVFSGYLSNPTATAETIDDEGWLHSGDLGKVDAEGYLSITGRLKELIVTAGGENVPPVLIEEIVKSKLPMVSQAMVIGDRRKFLSVLLTFKFEPKKGARPGEYPFTNVLAAPTLRYLKAVGFTGTTIEEAIASKEVTDMINKGLAAANAEATSNAQKVQKFTLLPVDWTVEGTEMTATQKLKRKIVNAKYETEIEAMYK